MGHQIQCLKWWKRNCQKAHNIEALRGGYLFKARTAAGTKLEGSGGDRGAGRVDGPGHV